MDRERFQGRRTKKFNAKNIHFDKSKLEKNKRNNTKKLGNFCIEPRHPTDSRLWNSTKHEILRRSREDLRKRWISRDVNPGKNCVDLISPRNFWQSAVFLRKKDAQNSGKTRTFRMKLREWKINPAVKKRGKDVSKQIYINPWILERSLNDPRAPISWNSPLGIFFKKRANLLFSNFPQKMKKLTFLRGREFHLRQMWR